jgi:hypothetical protein
MIAGYARVAMEDGKMQLLVILDFDRLDIAGRPAPVAVGTICRAP